MVIPVLLPESSSGQERANLVLHYNRKKAQATQPITAITSIYKHELNYKLIDRHVTFQTTQKSGLKQLPTNLPEAAAVPHPLGPYDHRKVGHPHFHRGWLKESL